MVFIILSLKLQRTYIVHFGIYVQGVYEIIMRILYVLRGGVLGAYRGIDLDLFYNLIPAVD